MKKILFTLLLGCIVQGMRAQTINDPNAQVRTVPAFHAVQFSHALDIYLSQGNEEGVVVSAATEKDRDDIVTEVKDGVLYIGIRKGMKWTKGNRKMKAYVSFKQLDRVEAGGACNLYIANTWKASTLLVKLSGASDLKGNLSAEALTVELSGASDVSIRGGVKQLKVEASGASNFKGYDLQSDYCSADASGASEIHITVNKELSVEASGASRIRYRGDAVIRELKNSGASSVSKAS